MANNDQDKAKEKAGAPQEEPLKLTPRAATKVREIFEQEEVSLETKIRVKVVGGGCAGFQYDMVLEEPGQEVSAASVEIVSQGITLSTDEMSLMYLRGTEIDYVDTLQGSGFKFKNPLISTTCGCGKSFTV